MGASPPAFVVPAADAASGGVRVPDAAPGASARYDLVTPAGETTTERHDDVTAPLPAPGEPRRTLLAFAPYIVVSVLHVAVLVAGLDDAARASKLLLMPALALAVLLTARPLRGTVPVLLLVAIGLSWGGDALLNIPGDLGFVVGLASFLLAHVTYVVLFLRLPARGRRLPAWTAVYAAWYVAFLALLAPHLGGLLAAGRPVRPRPGRHGGDRGPPRRAASPSAARCSSSRTRCSRSGGSCRATSSRRTTWS